MRDLDKLLQFLRQEQVEPVKATLDDLRHFAAALYDLGIGARSQCRILSGVRSFYHFLLTDGYIDSDPTELLESPQLGAHLPEVLSTEEVEAAQKQGGIMVSLGRRILRTETAGLVAATAILYETDNLGI